MRGHVCRSVLGGRLTQGEAPWLFRRVPGKEEEERRFCCTPPFPLWPTLREARLSCSRAGWALQEVPKKTGENISSGLHDQRQHRKGAERHRVPNSGGVPCLSAPVCTCLGRSMLQCPLHPQPDSALRTALTIPQCPNFSSLMPSFLLAPSLHTRLHCARVPPYRCGDTQSEPLEVALSLKPISPLRGGDIVT